MRGSAGGIKVGVGGRYYWTGNTYSSISGLVCDVQARVERKSEALKRKEAEEVAMTVHRSWELVEDTEQNTTEDDPYLLGTYRWNGVSRVYGEYRGPPLQPRCAKQWSYYDVLVSKKEGRKEAEQIATIVHSQCENSMAGGSAGRKTADSLRMSHTGCYLLQN